MKRINQDGATHLMIILFVIVIGVVGFLGWRAVQAINYKNKTADSSQKNEVNTNTKTESGLFDYNNPQKFVQADFVELDKVYEVSKFRSGVGHDFSYGTGESCRSMKHYFTSIDPTQPDYKQLGGGDKAEFPAPSIEKDVKIFSPVDGTLKTVNYDNIAYNQELAIVPDDYPEITIRLMHVQNAPGIKDGKIKAGGLIGLVLANQSFDIAIQVMTKGPNKMAYVSYFDVLPDSLMKNYIARGVKSREQLIITKKYRDTHPYQCVGKEVFVENYLVTEPIEANVVQLSGYDEVAE